MCMAFGIMITWFGLFKYLKSVQFEKDLHRFFLSAKDERIGWSNVFFAFVHKNRIKDVCVNVEFMHTKITRNEFYARLTSISKSNQFHIFASLMEAETLSKEPKSVERHIKTSRKMLDKCSPPFCSASMPASTLKSPYRVLENWMKDASVNHTQNHFHVGRNIYREHFYHFRCYRFYYYCCCCCCCWSNCPFSTI